MIEKGEQIKMSNELEDFGKILINDVIHRRRMDSEIQFTAL